MSRAPTPGEIVDRLTDAINSKRVNGHVCHFNRCKIVNLHVEIHESDGVYGIKTRFLPPPPFVCSKDTLIDTVYNIYMCQSSGKVHQCHANCDGERMTNADDCVVCCISGIQYQSEAVRSWKIESRCLTSVPVNKQDPYKFSRDADGRVKLSRVHNLKTTQCVMLSKEIIFKLLFSPCRSSIEARKRRETLDRSRKLVNKYKRHCQRHNIVKNYIHMITMFISNQQTRANNVQILRKTKKEIDEIVRQYTIKLIGYWKMVLQKTELGQTMSSLFPFKSFVPACLYLMKNGVQMHGVYIVEKSRFLERGLPETNTLDAYNISKPVFTQSRNKIQEAIRESVETRYTTPSKLRDFAAEFASKAAREIL